MDSCKCYRSFRRRSVGLAAKGPGHANLSSGGLCTRGCCLSGRQATRRCTIGPQRDVTFDEGLRLSDQLRRAVSYGGLGVLRRRRFRTKKRRKSYMTSWSLRGTATAEGGRVLSNARADSNRRALELTFAARVWQQNRRPCWRPSSSRGWHGGGRRPSARSAARQQTTAQRGYQSRVGGRVVGPRAAEACIAACCGQAQEARRGSRQRMRRRMSERAWHEASNQIASNQFTK